MSMDQWCARYPDMSARKLAQRIIREDPDLVVQIVTDAVDHERRVLVREKEGQSVTEMLKSMRGGDASAPVPDNARSAVALFADILREKFALGNGMTVTWGEAKRSQHEQRIGMLRAMIRGTEQTINLHEKALELLKANEAECLNELAVPAAT